MVKIADLPRFDMADYLQTGRDVAEYLSVVMDENDPKALVEALGTVARARGIGEIAERSGLGRESLYKSLSPGAKPRFETICKIMNALGLKLTVSPVGEAPA